MIPDSELLRRYAEEGSEAAFAELVSRHLGLVYSAALRLVGGDTQMAQDVAQSVFADLSGKSRSLLQRRVLTGWLHTSTRFAAAKMVRTERRRQAREQEALAMNSLSTDSEPAWEELCPVLDEAVGRLNERDREAVLMRFFEGKEPKEIGLLLGLNENAAQMRVRRALDKLRIRLGKFGITSTTMALASVLTAQATKATPAGLATTVADEAIAGGIVKGSIITSLFLKLLTVINLKLALGTVAITVVLIAFLLHQYNIDIHPPLLMAAAHTSPGTAAPSSILEASQTATDPQPYAVDQMSANFEELRLIIVAADSGKPLPNVPISYRGWVGSEYSKKDLSSNREGTCEVAFPTGTTRLELTTRIDGFADTRLHWNVERGEKIPPSYTLRLLRPSLLSGCVVDPRGQPVAGATVSFGQRDDPAFETWPEDHLFRYVVVDTDGQGRWVLNRIASEMISSIETCARHPEFLSSDILSVGQNPDIEKQLREGNHVFQLGWAVTVRGVVIDPEGRPISGAKVLVGNLHLSGSRQTESLIDGTFVVAGCQPGKNLLTAEAKGFAAVTQYVELTTNRDPFQIVLPRGKTLRLRVIDRDGRPIPNATVGIDPLPANFFAQIPPGPAPVQTQFRATSDAEGRVAWDSAPDGEVQCGALAPGFMRVDRVTVRADGKEQVITLPTELVITGTVRDAVTGQLLPRFRIVCGWPEIERHDGSPYPHWSTSSEHWMSFCGGEFRHAFAESIGRIPNPGYLLKFEAEGYTPVFSRTLGADEGEVRLDVTLHRATTLTVSTRLPDGRAALGAQIGLVSWGAFLRIVPGGLLAEPPDPPQGDGSLAETDAQGCFPLPSDDAITRVIVTHSEGWADVSPVALRSQPTVCLQPWGQLDGTLSEGDQNAASPSLYLEFGNGSAAAVSFDRQAFQVRPDEQGRFLLSRVPPGRHRLVQQATQMMPDRTAGQPKAVAEVDIRPGETTTIRLGDQ